MEKIKYYKIFLDGIDKTGKDIIANYVDRLSNRKYIVKPRGIVSMIVYSKIFNREYEYDIKEEDVVNVLLMVEKDDWEIRCKLTNEELIDYETHSKCFIKEFNSLDCVHKLAFNTSKETPYSIAKEIIKYMEKINKEN